MWDMQAGGKGGRTVKQVGQTKRQAGGQDRRTLTQVGSVDRQTGR